jgi:hypothetical protein
LKACDSQWLKIQPSAAKSAHDDKRGFCGVRIGPESGAEKPDYSTIMTIFFQELRTGILCINPPAFCKNGLMWAGHAGDCF